MSNSLRSFQDLECWKASRRVKILVREIIKILPKQEQYDLIDNMRRASRSCTRNIAEGFGRFHYQENIQFCRISRGSLMEIWDDLITCLDDKYITEEKFKEGIASIEHAIKVLNGYISYLQKAKASSISNIVKEPSETYGNSPDLSNDSITYLPNNLIT